MKDTELEIFLLSGHIPFEKDVDLKRKTWIHRGGKAHYYVIPDSVDQLCNVVNYCYKNHIEFKIVGHTSNLYIRNTTDIEVVLSTIHLNRYNEEDGLYQCECGVAIADLSKKAIKNGHAGYEGFVNLPGTVASATVNNAGCFQCSISDILLQAEVLGQDGKIRIFTRDQFNYSERSSAFKRGEAHGVILRVVLDCHKLEDKDCLLQKAEANTIYRKTKQEGPKQNLGSTYPIYVMEAFYKNLPLHTRFCLMISAKFYHIINKQRPQTIINTIILLCSGCYFRLHRYVSKHNFGCFVWRDAKADKAFDKYASLIAKTAKLPDMGIEVI